MNNYTYIHTYVDICQYMYFVYMYMSLYIFHSRLYIYHNCACAINPINYQSTAITILALLDLGQLLYALQILGKFSIIG